MNSEEFTLKNVELAVVTNYLAVLLPIVEVHKTVT